MTLYKTTISLDQTTKTTHKKTVSSLEDFPCYPSTLLSDTVMCTLSLVCGLDVPQGEDDLVSSLVGGIVPVQSPNAVSPRWQGVPQRLHAGGVVVHEDESAKLSEARSLDVGRRVSGVDEGNLMG